MHLKLGYHQPKRDCNKHKVFYVSFMVNTKKKPTVDTENTIEKLKYTTIEIKSEMKTAREEEMNKGTKKKKTKQKKN